MADPTRQAIITRLRMGPQNVARLAQGFAISRPAISQHLKVLSDAGLLTVTPQGTRRIYALNPDRMRDMRDWMNTLWDDALDAFARAAHDLAKARPCQGRTPR
ncbi:MAG: metalloregulator ArsR/SmtB family transcription factor [Rhodobacteraceae bacterium]|nr:metalloregulator ArsR/SmtB family transcription factor [Paracoccaceae bacterium]